MAMARATTRRRATLVPGTPGAYDSPVMKSNVLAEALTNRGGFSEKDGVLRAGDSPVSLFVALGQTLLTIEKVREVQLTDDAVTFQTRSELFVFALEDVRGVRVALTDSRAGFPA